VGSFVKVVVFGVAGGVIGALAGMVLASVYAAATSMPAREGGPGGFAVAIGFVAGIAGLVAGTVYGMYRVAGMSGIRIGGWVALAFGGLALAFVGYRWYYTHSQDYFMRKHGSVPLEVEVRGAAAHLPTTARVQATLVEGPAGAAMPVEWNDTGRTGVARLWRVTGDRKLVVDGQTVRLDLPSFPGESTDWSAWVAVGKAGTVELRYRIWLGAD
jgi:hypothetical protein